jgi:hypothetical protein
VIAPAGRRRRWERRHRGRQVKIDENAIEIVDDIVVPEAEHATTATV